MPEQMGAGMKNILILGALTLIAWLGVSAQQMLFPEPPAEYRVVYLGSPNCGVCQHWKRNMLPSWKSEDAASYLDIEMARLNGRPFNGGYGKHDPVFREAFKNKRYIAYPSFVLYKRGKIERVYQGVKGWNAIEKRVRAEAKRIDRRAPA
ncbi:MAG: hypothetical protein AAGJ68_07505 [Pseudomonadota bacterium]